MIHPSPIVRFAMLLLGALMLISSPFMIVRAFQLYQDQAAAESWPTTQGIIRHSEVRREEAVTNVRYQAVVEYTYAVDGEEFKGSRITLQDTPTQDQASAERKVRMYSPGTPVRVYYSPADPGTSLLEPSNYSLSIVLAAAGIAMLPAGAGLVWLARRSTPSTKLEIAVDSRAAMTMLVLQRQAGWSREGAIRLCLAQPTAQGLGVNVEFVDPRLAESLCSMKDPNEMVFVADPATASSLRGKTICIHEEQEGQGRFYAV